MDVPRKWLPLLLAITVERQMAWEYIEVDHWSGTLMARWEVCPCPGMTMTGQGQAQATYPMDSRRAPTRRRRQAANLVCRCRMRDTRHFRREHRQRLDIRGLLAQLR